MLNQIILFLETYGKTSLGDFPDVMQSANRKLQRLESFKRHEYPLLEQFILTEIFARRELVSASS